MSGTGEDSSDSYEKHLLDEDSKAIYVKSKRIANIFEVPAAGVTLAMILSIFFLTVNLVSYPRHWLANQSSILRFLQTDPAPFSKVLMFGGVFIVSFAILYLLLFISSRFHSNASSTGITQEKYRLDILAKGIEEFQDGNEEQAISQLKKFHKLEEKHIPSSMGWSVSKYIKRVENEKDEVYFNETFEDFLSILMQEILSQDRPRKTKLEIIANPSDAKYFTDSVSDDQGEDARKVTYRAIIQDAFTGYSLTSFTPHFWLIYLLAASVGVATFFFVDKTLGIITVTILLTALQIYERRNGNSEEKS